MVGWSPREPDADCASLLSPDREGPDFGFPFFTSTLCRSFWLRPGAPGRLEVALYRYARKGALQVLKSDIAFSFRQDASGSLT